jgi:hypothetical protein
VILFWHSLAIHLYLNLSFIPTPKYTAGKQRIFDESIYLKNPFRRACLKSKTALVRSH